MKYLVERYVFDEHTLQFKFDGTKSFKTEEELLKFINEVMYGAGKKYLWRITKTQEY